MNLRAAGVRTLSLFGSVARGEAGATSDVDLAVTLDLGRPIGLLRYAGLREELAEILETKVDLVTEPVSKPRLQSRIDRDRVHVF